MAQPRLPRLDPALVMQLALVEFRIDRMDLISGRREARFIKARAFVVWALRTLGEPLSYPELARLLGKSCHSVSINLHQRAIVFRLFDPHFAAACTRLARSVCNAKKEVYHGATCH